MAIDEKHIFFLSASDRINYGDLLFPIIFKKMLEGSGYIFHNYGIVASDLKGFGALATDSYSTMLSDIKKFNGKLVIGGGEVLFSEWEMLFGFISWPYARLNAIKFFSKVERRLQIARRALGGMAVVLPFSPLPKELHKPALKIYYSSVGGQFYGDLSGAKNKAALKAIQAAALTSVRDQRSQDSLKSAGVSAELIPDSALIMADYYPVETLKELSQLNPEIYRDPYIFVQLGRYKGPEDLKAFSQRLITVSEQLGLKVLLCPIGLAPGHEDDIILKQLADLHPDFKFVMPSSISDIMLLIALSKLYLGTSLHGLITAQSYNVPHIPLNKDIKKAVSYLNTWVDSTLRAADFTDDTYKNWPAALINENTGLQKEMVRKNLKHILND
ncbi:MAG: polysaccharide pyruvyl transferase family protein [Leeuwenhoekiella sp.]